MDFDFFRRSLGSKPSSVCSRATVFRTFGCGAGLRANHSTVHICSLFQPSIQGKSFGSLLWQAIWIVLQKLTLHDTCLYFCFLHNVSAICKSAPDDQVQPRLPTVPPANRRAKLDMHDIIQKGSTVVVKSAKK